jgi:hypothetical protein
MQILANVDDFLACETILGLTGMAIIVDDKASVRIFCNSAVSNSLQTDAKVFHIDRINEFETVIDLIAGVELDVSLPLSFSGMQMAVAQIAAALNYINGA